jgi:hypothetical protein
MSRVQISWDDEAKTIIRYDFDYAWTWAELEAANEKLEAMLKEVSREVCTIAVQNYKQHYMPHNPLSKISAMLPRRSQQIRLTVIVAHSSLISSILGLIVKLYPSASHLRFANTLDEARAMIRLYTIQRDY